MLVGALAPLRRPFVHRFWGSLCWPARRWWRPAAPRRPATALQRRLGGPPRFFPFGRGARQRPRANGAPPAALLPASPHGAYDTRPRMFLENNNNNNKFN